MTRIRDVTPRLAPEAITPPGVPDLSALAPPWMDDAACTPDTADLFYPTSWSEEAAQPAIAICKTCPVWRDCLDHAQDVETISTDSDAPKARTHGVWAGLTAHQRIQSRRTAS